MYFGFDLSEKLKKITKPTIVIDKKTEENLRNLQNWYQKGMINEDEYRELKKKALRLD